MRLVRAPRLASAVYLAGLLCASSAAAAWAQGTVSGRVSAQGTNQPLEEVRVLVVGTSIFTTTGVDGRYTLRNVPTGTAEVRVLRVGYQEQKKPITVAAGQTAALDFSMQQTVVQLQEVVTTATGEQRRVEFGNTVATIDVAKKVQESPIKNMGDLLVAKAPGVQVLPANMTGGGSRVRIRGTASLSLSNDPIYIIDGIRMTSNSASMQIGVGGTSPSRVNDINPEEIENIEIVKGPSAATLYGTDAANGVIVITTKKGRAGAPRWNTFGEYGLVKDRNDYPSTYAILGHAPATPTTVRRCLLRDISQNTCIPDSSLVLDVWEDPDLSPIKNGYRNNFGLQLSGGTETLRYFTSGEFENEMGPFGMPAFDQRRFEAANVPILGNWKRPNALQKSSVRVNLNATVNPTLDLSLQSGFIKLDQRLPQVDNNVNSFWFNGMTGPGFKGAGPGYTGVGSLGQPLLGYASFTPGDIFQRTPTQNVQRYIGSVNANWRPLSWMQNRADLGVDLADRVESLINRFAQGPDFSTNRLGSASDARTNIRNFTMNVASTLSYQALPWMGLKTTGGVQYVNSQLDLAQATGSTLPPGAQTPADGVIPSVNSATQLQKTLGYFVEEAAAIRDRLFLTVAARSDQNSAFGTNFQSVVYPKGSVSWLVSDESFFPQLPFLNQFRLRTSVGASGVQPGPNDAARTLGSTQTSIASVDVSAVRTSNFGNPNIKPEKSTEFEAGFDSRLLNSRVNLEATYYSKVSRDALFDLVFAPSAGTSSSTIKTNLGKVRNAGLEGLINAQVVDLRSIGWDVTLSLSHNANKLITLGKDANGKQIPPIIGNTIQEREGYPLLGYWQRPYTYTDANSDGYITANEVTVGDSAQFVGYSQPRDELSISNGVELLGRRLRINTLVDYKGGSNLLNSEEQFLCQQSTSCPETSSLDAPLWRQARAIAQRDHPARTQYGYIERLQFWRIRELSATYTLSDQFAGRYLRARGGSITGGIRNLHVFTKYTGVDPEANYSQGDTQLTLLTAGPPSYFTFRLNLSY